MIRVTPSPEPSNFDQNVRQPGRQFLGTNPAPNSKEFGRHNYWRRAAADLHRAYRGVCAYTSMYILPAPGTVDHFQPKSAYPALAYEWSNYRLALQKVNGYKDSAVDLIDPFTIELGWFTLEFPGCLVKPGIGLASAVADKVARTIDVLKLNADDTFVQKRCDILMELVEGRVTLDFLWARYPFLASEVVRQGGLGVVGPLFKRQRRP